MNNTWKWYVGDDEERFDTTCETREEAVALAGEREDGGYICESDREVPGVETVKIDMTTHVPRSRYAKLMTFRPDIADILGPRILQLDLDTVIVRNIDAIVERDDTE